MFEASITYKIKGTDKYLTIVEALGNRYYRAYVADKLDGEWYPIEGFDTMEKPFAGKANVTFESGVEPWSVQVSHGELILDSNDERMILRSEQSDVPLPGHQRSRQQGGLRRFALQARPAARREIALSFPSSDRFTGRASHRSVETAAVDPLWRVAHCVTPRIAPTIAGAFRTRPVRGKG